MIPPMRRTSSAMGSMSSASYVKSALGSTWGVTLSNWAVSSVSELRSETLGYLTR